MGIDEFYTPAALAQRVAGAVSSDPRPGLRIVDFAAGQGALLHAAAERFPESSLWAADISERSVRRLREAGGMSVSRCDFLDGASRSRARVTRPDRRYDVALLNPPFSYRGHGGRSVDVLGVARRVSPAAAFVSVAASYLSADAELVAIVPAGTLTSDRDAVVWDALRLQGQVAVLDTFGRGTFPQMAARTVLVRLTKGSLVVPTHMARPVRPLRLDARLVRGCTPMYRVRAGDDVELVHSTDIKGGRAQARRVQAIRGRMLSGPAVLLPRVGRPSAGKIAVWTGDSSVLLSDCVVGLETKSDDDARRLQSLIVEDWADFALAWGGSCAPYITLRRLEAALAGLGVRCVSEHDATAQPADRSLVEAGVLAA
jgi:predicted RNA methylase